MPQAVEVIQGGQTRTVEFPDEMSRAEIEAALRQQFPMPDMRQSTFGEELTRGVERLKTDYLTAYNSFGNPEQAALEALRRNQEVAQELGLPPSLAETAEIFATQGIPEGVLNALGDVPRGIAQQAPMTGTILGASTAAAAVTPPTLPFVGPMAKPVAGALAGYGATLGPLYSQNLQRQAEADLEAGRPVDVSRVKAAGAAAVQGVAELLGAYMVGGTTLVSKALGLAPSQIGQRSSSALVNVAKDALRGVKRGAAGEIPTEFAQQVIERAQADLDLFSDEALAEYGEAAYMAGIAGGGLGGITGAVSPAIAPSPIEDLPGDLPTTADLSEITQETITPDLADIEPTPDISAETLRAQTEEKLALIAPKLRGVLKGRGLDDIGISLSYELDPEALARTDDPDDAEALFDPTARSILLAADRIQGFEQMDASQLQTQFAGLVDHEMVHGAKHFGLWTDAEWTVLENAARRRTNSNGQTYMDAAKSSYTKATPEIQREEAVAELVRDTFAGRTGLAGQPLNLMQRLIEFFRKMGNALTGTGYASFNQVINDIDSGVLGARPRYWTQTTDPRPQSWMELALGQQLKPPMIVDSPALASRYRGEHTAPVRYERNTLDDLSDIYPDDVYSNQGARYYGSELDARIDQEAIKVMRKAYRNPEAEVTIYRAVPEGIEDINPGDWVSLTPEYADSHGSSWVGEDYHVLEKRVKANDVVTNGDSLQEWGYAPADQTPLASRRLKSDAQAQQQLPLPEGMTGAEVAAEESRLAEQEQMRERNRAGVAEARRILEDDQQPLASRRQKTAQGLRALGDVPRPPRDAGWEQRAREQGFDTGRVLYHYTDKFEFGGREFEQFIPSAAGRLGPGVYTSPDADYAERHILRGPSTGGARAIPVFARGRIANEEDYQQALELAIDDYRTRTTDAVNAYTVKKLAKEILEEQGFSGIERQDNKGKEVVIFDPKNLRSIHANFDPARTESTTLLASRRRDAGWKQRAREQGFDTDTVYYHGTGKVFDEFDTQIGRGARTGTGTFLSVNPTVASTYASDARDDQANILPAYVRLKNPITVYADGNNWSRLGPDIQVDVPQRVIDQTQDGDLLEELGFDRGSDTRTEPMGTYTLRELFPNALLDSENMDTNDIARWARQQQGVDGIIFEDIRDLGPWRPGIQRGVDREAFLREINAPTRNVLVFDAKNIRSVNAQFDPAQTDSPKLLASRGRLDRAKEQGFDTENILYHGTASDIKEFDPSKFGDTTKANSARLGAWLVSDPEVASGYARYAAEEAPVQKLIEESDAAGRAGNFDLQEQLTIQAEDLDLGRSLVDAGGQNVVPLVVRGSLFEVDAEGQTLGDLDDGQLVTWAQEAKNNGFDGLKIKNFSDNIDWGNYVSADHYLIFDPENIRSVNAEFDSDQTESPRLLASRKLKTKPEDSAALAEDKSKGATEVRGNPESDRAAAEEVRKVKTLASRVKPSDIVESTAYNRVADVASTRASRGQGNINNALAFEMPSSADDHSIVFQMQDKLIDLKNTEKAIKDNQRKHGLTLLKDSESPYLGEESMHGIIGNKFNRFEKDEVRPLVDKLTRRNITRQELEEFLVLRHAIERNAHVRKLNAASKEPRADLQDGGAGSLNGQRLLDDYVKQQMRSQYGMTWNDSTKSWEGGNRKAAIMNDLANDFDAITRGTLKELKDSGLINQDSLDKLQGYYKYYAPLRGLAPDEDAAVEEHARISRRANNLSIKGVETEIAKGRVSEASPPLGQIIFQRQNAIKRGTVNDVVGQRMLNLIRENPNEDYWKIHTDRKYADVVGKELLGVKEDGKQYFIELKDPRLRQAMMSLDAGQMNKALSLMRGVNRYLSAVMTSYNPSFIAPNFTRDITTAISNLVGEQNAVDGKALNTDGLIGAVIRDVGPSVREVYRGLRGKNLNKKLAQDWKDYMESGAKTEWFHVRSPEESTRDIDDLIAMSKGTFKGNMKAGKDAIAGWVSDINGAIENGVRFATFKNARDAFIKNGDSRKEALAKAASLAKNLTVNFNRKGNSGEQLNALYLFFNASVQGTANFLRNLNSPAKRRLLGSMVSFGALTAWLNEMVSEEDDDGRTYYANLEPYVKERNLVIMKSINPFYDGHPKGVYTIPLPYGYNTLHVLGVNTVEAAMGLISPQDAAARVASTALGSFSPVGFGTSENPGKWLAKGATPQIGKPIMEILLNEDFFGSPVYTTPFEFGPQIPVANLSQRSTPEAFKQTTRFLNRLPLLGPGTGGDESTSGPLGWISPDALHHYFGSMIGGTGMFAERTGRLVGESADYFQETDGPISLDDFFERQDLTVNDIPILRRFNHESRGFIAQSRYYDRKEDIMAADRQVDILRGAERGEYIRENRPLLQMKRTIDNSDKRLRNINRRLARIGEQILNATSLESTIRLEEEQHRLEEIKRGVYNRFNKLFDERVGRTE